MRSSPFTPVTGGPLTVTKLGDFRPKFGDQYGQLRPSSLQVNGACIENVNDRAFASPKLPSMLKSSCFSDVHIVLREQGLQTGSQVELAVSSCTLTRRIV